MNWLVEFLTAAPWYMVVFIFLAKILEVTISTIRIIIVNRGFKIPGAIFSFFEVLIWVFVASSVVNDIKAAPLLGIVYAAGFGVGVYVGSTIENLLAFGKVMLNIIVPSDNLNELSTMIRDRKIGLTIIDAKGLSSDKHVLMLYTNRQNIEELKKAILYIEPKALIGENDVVKLSGGTMPKRQRIVK